MREAKIVDRLTEHLSQARDYLGSDDRILGVFLYGSQNYGTDTDESDVDTKCIVVPDLYHLACSPDKVQRLRVGSTNEFCEVMPIQHVVAGWKKQSISFLEILFTKHCIINPAFRHIWSELQTQWGERVARYDPKRALLAMSGQALQSLRQKPQDFKVHMNLARLYWTACKYITETPYREAIQVDDRLSCAEIRTKGLSELSLTFFQSGLTSVAECPDRFIAHKPDKAPVDAALDTFILDCVKVLINR